MSLKCIIINVYSLINSQVDKLNDLKGNKKLSVHWNAPIINTPKGKMSVTTNIKGKINNNVNFAAKSASVVPAELGVNVIFLIIFAIIVQRSVVIAFSVSIIVWIVLSFLLFFIGENLD